MVNITIDGLSGCGKSSLARGLAERLGYKVLNTGAIYRGLACAFLEQGFNEPSESNINEFLKELSIEVRFEGDVQHIIVNGKDYTPDIRREEISRFTSLISPYDALRERVRQVQREFAENNNCIIEGRGVAFDVLPHAKIKLFVTASDEARATRRYLQIKDMPNAPTFDEVLKDLKARDYADEHREHGKNVPAHDSIIVDTTNMNLLESIDYVEKIVRARLDTKA